MPRDVGREVYLVVFEEVAFVFLGFEDCLFEGCAIFLFILFIAQKVFLYVYKLAGSKVVEYR